MIHQIDNKSYINAARQIGCDPAAIKAVAIVESNGSPFNEDRSLKMLFEGHVFWRQLTKAGINPSDHVTGNHDILFKNWQRDKYLGGELEYKRLEKALKIDKECALKSASWGAFQIMGYHAEALGFPDVFSFVFHLDTGIEANFDVFSRFINKDARLVKALKELDFEKFKHIYNGPGKNNYAERMNKTYNKYKTEF